MEAHFFVILAHWRLRQEEHKFEPSLGSIVRPCLTKKGKKREREREKRERFVFKKEERKSEKLCCVLIAPPLL
jgi:hypothetical protein